MKDVPSEKTKFRKLKKLGKKGVVDICMSVEMKGKDYGIKVQNRRIRQGHV